MRNEDSNCEESLFEAALQFDDERARRAFLDASCDGEPELRERLDLLMKGHFRADRFLAGDPGGRRVEDELIGMVVDRYRLLEKIGEGGFGSVYAAEQIGQVKRLVAIKVIKLGMDTRQVVARFEGERQALALMDHPNIAKVFDGGATPSGRPYFVMEHVQGVSITAFCKQSRLPIRARLELFMSACRAVQHAHQKGIIHRDLKPSNILVTTHDGAPVAKVIDFGIAKATGRELVLESVLTQFRQFMGTPAYVSPEQVEMAGAGLDTRSDIYSLGVVLYELLTGSTPFDSRELLASGLEGMQRVICEKEPLVPSARIARLHPVDRMKPPRAADNLLAIDSDLDWVVMKCLEKDRSRRYESVHLLVADIERHLRQEPVTARPPTVSYRLRKFIRRHRISVVAGTFAISMLIAAVGVSSWQAVRADRERAAAERRFRKSVQLMTVTVDRVLPKLGDLIGTTTAREELTQAMAEIVAELQGDPSPTPELRQLIGAYHTHVAFVKSFVAYSGLTTGEFDSGMKSAEDAIQVLAPAMDGSESVAVARCLARAEMSAYFAATSLLRFDEAFGHVNGMEKWAGMMAKGTNLAIASYGTQLLEWGRQLKADNRIRAGRPQEALDRYLGTSLDALRSEASILETASFGSLWTLQGEVELMGAAHLRLGHREEAATLWRERLRIGEIEHQRWPHHAGVITGLVESEAQLGEVLLGLGNAREALPLLESSLKRLRILQELEPANTGLLHLKVKVLQSHAAGYAAWAAIESDPVPERIRRLGKAGEILNRVVRLVDGIKSESYQRFLRYELDPIQEAYNRVRGELGVVASASGESIPAASPGR